ncbi:MAG: phosphotransferase family protein [Acidimicrobiia bacterium]|nr:phosphotransferase family protein [Acidimicrobiia bacterium]
MSVTDDATGDPVLEVDRLGPWLDTLDLPGRGAPIESRYLSGGSQNQIFEIRRGDLHAALRIPPPTAPASRDAGIVREWRIIEALAGTDVPHTDAITVCEDPSILGRTFYLMGFVHGWSPIEVTEWPEPFQSDVAARQGLAYELIDGIARLARVDWRAKGLHDLGHPDGFHDRQVDRWLAFLDRIKGRDLPGLDEASQWLRTHRPIDFVPGLMHGDYQFANVMYAHGGPARLAAIVDWEMGTVGDPKLDLAWVIQSWPEHPDDVPDIGYVDLTGMPTRDQLLARYAAGSGRQVDDMDYYLVLARWKLAIVLEQGFQRAGGDPKLMAFGDIVVNLMASAAETAARSDYR